jgi:membrane protein required for colicin V production
VGILLLVNLVGKIAKKILDMTLLGGLDNFAGAVLGLLKWAFGVSLVLWLATSVDMNLSNDLTDNTYVYPVLASVAPFVFDAISVYMPFIQEIYDMVKTTFTQSQF